jgi:hypothetical protein
MEDAMSAMSDRDHHLHVVVGRVPDLDHARTVLQELQNHGVDAADLRLAGTSAEQAERHTQDEAARERLDGRTVGHVGRRVGGGAVAGALAGAVIGAVGGFLATSGDVGGNLTLFLVVVLVFAALGAWVAATVTATASMGYDDTWQLTFGGETDGDVAEEAWIAVRVRDAEDAAGARQVFASEGITAVEEHTADAHGEHMVRW